MSFLRKWSSSTNTSADPPSGSAPSPSISVSANGTAALARPASPVIGGSSSYASASDSDDAVPVPIHEEKYFGLENFGNTCYANSVLQALYFSKPFRELIESYPSASSPATSTATVTTSPTTLRSLLSPSVVLASVLPKKPSTFVNLGSSASSGGAATTSSGSAGVSTGIGATNGSAISRSVSRDRSVSAGMGGIGSSNQPSSSGKPALRLSVSPSPSSYAIPLPSISLPFSTPSTTMSSTPAATTSPPGTLLSTLHTLFRTLSSSPSAPSSLPSAVTTSSATSYPPAVATTINPAPLALPPALGAFIAQLRAENEFFRSTAHQDAHEFLGWVLNRLGELVGEREREEEKEEERHRSEEERERSAVQQARDEGADMRSIDSDDVAGGEGREKERKRREKREERERSTSRRRRRSLMRGSSPTTSSSSIAAGSPTDAATHANGHIQEKRKGSTAKKRGERHPISGVHELFEGILTNETRCLTCETVTSRDEAFLDLSIDIEPNSSVTNCLRQFSANEMLCQRNKFSCDTCCGLQEAEKRMKIKKLPSILALHLKRFKYEESLQRHVKLLYRVPFPFDLRLPNTATTVLDPDRLYHLFAIIVHIGLGPSHGHYITIVKGRNAPSTPAGVGAKAKWIMFDDTAVSYLEESEIGKYFGDTPGVGSGYVLFYEAVDLVDHQREAGRKEGEMARDAAAAAAKTQSATKGLGLDFAHAPTASAPTSTATSSSIHSPALSIPSSVSSPAAAAPSSKIHFNASPFAPLPLLSLSVIPAAALNVSEPMSPTTVSAAGTYQVSPIPASSATTIMPTFTHLPLSDLPQLGLGLLDGDLAFSSDAGVASDAALGGMLDRQREQNENGSVSSQATTGTATHIAPLSSTSVLSRSNTTSNTSGGGASLGARTLSFLSNSTAGGLSKADKEREKEEKAARKKEEKERGKLEKEQEKERKREKKLAG